MGRWDLRRNCALTPRQCVASCGGLCAVTVSIGLVLWWMGFAVVALFAALEAVGVAVAIVHYARHARDGDTVTLRDGCIEVVHNRGGEVTCHRFQACWVSVANPSSPDALVTLRQHGREVRIGASVRPAQRRAVERDLRSALREQAAVHA